MAGRNQRTAADYFSHDADASSDEKIVYLESIFGHSGYALYFKFLERMTRSDNFKIEWNDIKKSVYAAEFRISVTEIDRFISECCRKEIKAFVLEKNHLFSIGLINRMKPLIEKREYNRQKYEEKKTNKNKPLQNSVKISGISVTEITQRKGKERKVKESKVKKINTLYAELKKYLEQKIIQNNMIETKDKIFEFFNYRMNEKIKGKKQPYSTEKGIDGLFIALNGCRDNGLIISQCIEKAMQDEWLKPDPAYFNNNQKQSRQDSNKQACYDFINGV